MFVPRTQWNEKQNSHCSLLLLHKIPRLFALFDWHTFGTMMSCSRHDSFLNNKIGANAYLAIDNIACLLVERMICEKSEDQRNIFEELEGEVEDVLPEGLPWTWNVTAQSLRLLPSFHPPLQRMAKSFSHVPVETVSARISTFMRLNSIACSYYTHLSCVMCWTANSLRFTVQLWEDQKDSCHTVEPRVIVEIQRRQGCSVEMQAIRKRLIDFISSGNAECCSPSPSQRHREPSKLVQRLHNDKSNEQRQNLYSDKETKDFEISLDLLESTDIDKTLLGMEMLSTLTDPTKAHLNSAKQVSYALVYGEGDYAQRVRNAFEDCFFDGMVGEYDMYTGSMTSVTLLVLQNALNIVSRDFEREVAGRQKMIDFSGCFWQSIIDGLVRYLESARTNPHNAALSAGCLRILNSMPEDAICPFSHYPNLPLALHSSSDYGKTCHSKLERETRLLSYRFNNVPVE